jgi:hypothetical protein
LRRGLTYPARADQMLMTQFVKPGASK